MDILDIEQTRRQVTLTIFCEFWGLKLLVDHYPTMLERTLLSILRLLEAVVTLLP